MTWRRSYRYSDLWWNEGKFFCNNPKIRWNVVMSLESRWNSFYTRMYVYKKSWLLFWPKFRSNIWRILMVSFLKINCSEKATKMCAIVLMVWNLLIKRHNHIRTIAQIFVAFSEKLNFNCWYVESFQRKKTDDRRIHLKCPSKRQQNIYVLLNISYFIRKINIVSSMLNKLSAKGGLLTESFLVY